MNHNAHTTAVGERLQKVLARAGLGSRRKCEALIEQGRVTVDGRVVTELGTRVDARGQQITVDGETVRSQPHVYYLLNKPKGFLTTDYDPEGRPRAVDLMPDLPQRVFSVGRLDKDSEGLLLLTNDGELTNRLAHPRYGVPKTYVVQVAGAPTPDDLAKLRDWFEEFASQLWDAQIERDAKAGKLDRLAAEALAEHKAGRTKPL